MKQYFKPSLLAVSLFFLPSLARAQEKKPTAAAVQFFETKVRPVLVANCFECHADKKQRGDLRLDSLAAMLEGGEQGAAIVPGHPEKSLLVRAINQGGKLKMPPKNKKLTRDEIDAVTQWIAMGAPWPGSDKATPTRKGEFQISDKDRAHWAYQSVKRPTLPAVKNEAWVRNPIDAFILAKLEAKGLAPAPPASKQEIARRLYYDLTGLPPTPKDIEVFVNDAASDAYEKLVDKLLASPHYGEKWARHWLDLVRYAETNSYERDNPKPHIWRYRDYVIRAFNEDKPFDRFLREQLAGDEIYPGDSDALIGTGFYRLGVWDDEPVDRLQARYDGLDDIIATIGQSMLGMTLDCARCHNHKIDPIAQKDYYKMVAFLHGISHYRGGGADDVRPIGNAKQMEAFKKIEREHEEKRAKAQAILTAIENDFRKLYKPGAQLVGSDLDELTYRFYRNAWTKLPDFSQFKHEDEGKLPKKLFDISPRTRNEAFGFVYEGFLIVPEDGKYTFFLDSDDGSRLAVAGKAIITYDGIHGMGKVQTKSVELKKGRTPIKLEYFQNVYGYGLYVGWSGPGFEKRSLSAPSDPGAVAAGDLTEQMHREGARVLGEQKYKEWFTLLKQMNFLRKAPAMPNVDMALCVVEAGAKAPDTFIFNRGSPNVPGDKVEPGFPTVFNLPDPPMAAAKPGAKSSGRRTVLANWIASKENPMTARVMVNRLWQHHFGRGIVRTPNDYGIQGMRPTHPELLDWLASEFVDPSKPQDKRSVPGGETPWSMKAMHKLILTSSAYRMASRTDAQATELGIKLDVANDLFWHFDMRRLSAEEIRDSILAVSGNLNLKMAGPGIYPPIPKEVLAGQSVPGRGWPVSSPEEAARRSVYVHVKRSLLLPILDAFDLAEPDRTTAVRFSSTVPTQALSFLNGDFINQQAKIFANRLKKEAGNDVNAQVRHALYLASARQPGDAEVRRGVGLIETLEREDGVSADVALQSFCLVVLNLNELVYLD
jgi:mono/diheme cytochrome c family protein